MSLQSRVDGALYSEIAKSIDAEIQRLVASSSSTSHLQQLYFNRGWCYQQLECNRKALKDFNEALRLGGSPLTKMHLHRGQVLWALGKKQEARGVWQKALDNATLADDLTLVQMLISMLKDPDAPKRVAKPPPPPVETEPKAAEPNAEERQIEKREEREEETVVVSQRVKDMLAEMRPEEAVGLAVEKINQGELVDAEEMLEELAKRIPNNPGVRVARGTARALLRKLESAIEDFSMAIKVYPMYGESWKRRGQARGALGQNEDAIADLQKALELSPDHHSKAECLTEQGMLYHKLKDFRKAVEVLEKSVGLNSKSAQAMNMLGLCRISLGDIAEGLEAYDRTIQIDRFFKEVYFNKCQALKEVGRVKEAEKVYWEGRRIERELGVEKHLGINRVMASMYQGMGQHHKAIPFLDEALESPKFKQKLECNYLRAACYQAMGRHADAVRDYMSCMEFEKSLDKEDGEERRQLVVLAFYQKEMSLYLRHKIDVPISQFCLDIDLPPIFKELWCKKVGPTRELIMKYSFQKPIKEMKPPPRPAADKVSKILNWADQLGILLQNRHQGFLPNDRQQRAAGCAALELAQAVLSDLEARKAGQQGWMVPTKGSSGGKGQDGKHRFHWRDAMDILVKWRQLSEPNDQVVWVDLLTPEEFAAGFGSHTPMFSGQTKCVRYYMNFERALKKQKEVLLKTGKAYNSKNEEILIQSSAEQQQIKDAITASDMYKIIKQDSWVIVPIASLTRPEETMEGTRLTLVKVPDQRDGFEFSIRTPVTPARWDQFEKDLQSAWEEYMEALQTGKKDEIARCILTYAYYWYNFMPLARGTAACGYTTILSLFWAAGMPITVSIPKDYQVDWEAILEPHPDVFITALNRWLVPHEARPDDCKGKTLPGSKDEGAKFPPPDALPRVGLVLDTTRKRLEALNGLASERI